MDAEKPFEVGEWVWIWSEQRWAKVNYAGRGEDVYGWPQIGAWFYNPSMLTRNPVIPPKPKEKRTVEVRVSNEMLMENEFCDRAHILKTVPLNAKNIRILYDIEE